MNARVEIGLGLHRALWNRIPSIGAHPLENYDAIESIISCDPWITDFKVVQGPTFRVPLVEEGDMWRTPGSYMFNGAYLNASVSDIVEHADMFPDGTLLSEVTFLQPARNPDDYSKMFAYKENVCHLKSPGLYTDTIDYSFSVKHRKFFRDYVCPFDFFAVNDTPPSDELVGEYLTGLFKRNMLTDYGEPIGREKLLWDATGPSLVKFLHIIKDGKEVGCMSFSDLGNAYSGHQPYYREGINASDMFVALILHALHTGVEKILLGTIPKSGNHNSYLWKKRFSSASDDMVYDFLKQDKDDVLAFPPYYSKGKWVL